MIKAAPAPTPAPAPAPTQIRAEIFPETGSELPPELRNVMPEVTWGNAVSSIQTALKSLHQGDALFAVMDSVAVVEKRCPCPVFFLYFVLYSLLLFTVMLSYPFLAALLALVFFIPFMLLRQFLCPRLPFLDFVWNLFFDCNCGSDRVQLMRLSAQLNQEFYEGKRVFYFRFDDYKAVKRLENPLYNADEARLQEGGEEEGELRWIYVHGLVIHVNAKLL